VAAVVLHAEDGAFVQRTEYEQIFKSPRHEPIVRDPRTLIKKAPVSSRLSRLRLSHRLLSADFEYSGSRRSTMG
jgi:hypothetical protein